MAEVTQERATPDREGPLRRVIGPKLLLLFIIGDILGAGVYALIGKVAGEVGGALWLPFLIAFVVAALTAARYVELVGKYPQAAGAALYTNRAFGVPFVTFIVAFAVMASGITSASASARAFGGDYLAEFVTLPVVLVAVHLPRGPRTGQLPGHFRVRQGKRRPDARRARPGCWSSSLSGSTRFSPATASRRG